MSNKLIKKIYKYLIPAPKWLGVDAREETLRVTELSFSHNIPTLINYYEVEKNLLKKDPQGKVVAGISISEAVCKKLSLPIQTSKKETEDQVIQNLQKYFSQTDQEISWDYQILESSNEQEIYFAACRKELTHEVTKIAPAVTFIEVDIFALQRLFTELIEPSLPSDIKIVCLINIERAGFMLKVMGDVQQEFLHWEKFTSLPSDANLGLQVHRVLQIYKANHSLDIQLILLAGNDTIFSSLAMRLQQTFAYKAYWITDYVKILIKPGLLDFEKHLAKFSVSLGLALRGHRKFQQSINLYPWREEDLQLTKKYFLTASVTGFILVIGLSFIWHFFLLKEIHTVKTENKFLTKKILSIHSQIQERHIIDNLQCLNSKNYCLTLKQSP